MQVLPKGFHWTEVWTDFWPELNTHLILLTSRYLWVGGVNPQYPFGISSFLFLRCFQLAVGFSSGHYNNFQTSIKNYKTQYCFVSLKQKSPSTMRNLPRLCPLKNSKDLRHRSCQYYAQPSRSTSVESTQLIFFSVYSQKAFIHSSIVHFLIGVRHILRYL